MNRYVLDPSRLAQGRNDASSNGHFPINNMMPSGTPRGFNLNMAHYGNGQMSMANPMSFNPMLGQFGVGMRQMGSVGEEHQVHSSPDRVITQILGRGRQKRSRHAVGALRSYS